MVCSMLHNKSCQNMVLKFTQCSAVLRIAKFYKTHWILIELRFIQYSEIVSYEISFLGLGIFINYNPARGLEI